MKLDSANASHTHPPTPPARSKLSRGGSPGAINSPIDSLSAASGAFARGPTRAGRPTRTPSLILSVIAGLIVGTVVTVTGPFEYVCRATFRIGGPPQTAWIGELRRTLADYVAVKLGSYSQLTSQTRWFIEPLGDSGLRLGLVASDRSAGLQRVRRLARGFVASLETAATTQSEAEKTLARLVEQRRTEVAAAMTQAESALSLVPSDPQQARDLVLQKWDDLRDEFRAKRKASQEALTELRRLQSEPDPTVGIVTSEERRDAWNADAGLQQDLSELAVSLSELKLQLLNAWQASAGPLDRLQSEVSTFQSVLDSAVDDPGLADARPRLTVLGDKSSDYRQLLSEFTAQWTSQFKGLDATEIDPHGGEVLDIYHRTQRRLADFLFKAEKQLAAIRDRIRDLDELRMDEARYHVFQSALLRAFHTMHAAYQRFAFAAGSLDTKNNFRLDTALTSALGLRKRSRAQIRDIEGRLEAAALVRARKRRVTAIAESRHAVDRLRSDVDDAVEQMITLQEELHTGADDSTHFLRARDRAKLAEDRLEWLRSDLAELQARLAELQAAPSAAEWPQVKVTSCEALERPINLGKRIQIGAIAAALTLLTVFLGQCWVARGG